MAKWQPKNLNHRSRQILKWCQESWPAPYPVRLRWVKDLVDSDEECPHYHAECNREGSVIVIRLSKRLVRSYAEMIDTLLHEYAHARDTKHQKLEDKLKRAHHGPEWGMYYAEMYSAYHDDTGWDDSRGY